MVHLFKSSALRLRHEEISPYQAQQAEHGEEDICSVASVLDERRGDQSYYEIAKVVVNDGSRTTGLPTYFNQFEHVDNATPLALKDEGKISEGSAHGTGPQLAPKDSM